MLKMRKVRRMQKMKNHTMMRMKMLNMVMQRMIRVVNTMKTWTKGFVLGMYQWPKQMMADFVPIRTLRIVVYKSMMARVELLSLSSGWKRWKL